MLIPIGMGWVSIELYGGSMPMSRAAAARYGGQVFYVCVDIENTQYLPRTEIVMISYDIQHL